MKYKHKKWFGGKGLLTEREYNELLGCEYVLTQGYYTKDTYDVYNERYCYLSDLCHRQASLLEEIVLFVRNIPSFKGLITNNLYMRFIYPYKYYNRFIGSRVFRLSAYIGYYRNKYK